MTASSRPSPQTFSLVIPVTRNEAERLVDLSLLETFRFVVEIIRTRGYFDAAPTETVDQSTLSKHCRNIGPSLAQSLREDLIIPSIVSELQRSLVALEDFYEAYSLFVPYINIDLELISVKDQITSTLVLNTDGVLDFSEILRHIIDRSFNSISSVILENEHCDNLRDSLMTTETRLWRIEWYTVSRGPDNEFYCSFVDYSSEFRISVIPLCHDRSNLFSLDELRSFGWITPNTDGPWIYMNQDGIEDSYEVSSFGLGHTRDPDSGFSYISLYSSHIYPTRLYVEDFSVPAFART